VSGNSGYNCKMMSKSSIAVLSASAASRMGWGEGGYFWDVQFVFLRIMNFCKSVLLLARIPLILTME